MYEYSVYGENPRTKLMDGGFQFRIKDSGGFRMVVP